MIYSDTFYANLLPFVILLVARSCFPSDAPLSSLEDCRMILTWKALQILFLWMPLSVRRRSVSASDDYVNVLRYDVSISGQEYTLLFP